ncbi:complement C3-like isoform X1 [Alosa pseudoharengus]|uniref:complement C3-like isoform X1 n=1 Tax=Alosa pseudoharengus TaxID=34774 RepID=UPI003F88BF01
MRVDLVVVCVAAVALSLPALSTCDPLYVMTAPNLLRVGTPEKVLVEAQDYAGDAFEVTLTVMDFPRKTRVIDTRTVTLNAANNYLALTEITIPDGRDLFGLDTDENMYVYLQATFQDRTLEKIVLLSFQSGYIFVQTDKTIYTPSSTVRYRIFSLSPGLKPVDSGISVEIMTPDKITISREILFPNKGIRSGEIKLPDIASFGIWKVVTRFKSTPQKNFTTQFEVKTYALPSYEVTLIPKSPFFYVDDDDLTVDILARYFHGREVTGTGLVMFGVLTQGNVKKSLPASLRRVEIREGKGEAMLTKEQIRDTFTDINQLVGSSLYVKVSVLTETGSEMVEAEKEGIPIVTSPYTINFKATPRYFKPGMPFDISVYVSTPDHLPARDIVIEVITATDRSIQATTRENGLAKVTVNTLDGDNTLSIQARTKVPGLLESRQAERNMTALVYRTTGGSRNYLHIGVATSELTIGQQIKMSLYVGNSPGMKNNQDFTYLILNKGQLVQAERFKRQGQTLVTLSLPVTKDMVPSFRIVAYYHVGSSEVVSDSVWVDVKDTCMGTLRVELTDPQKEYWPHKPFSLTITGDPGARVGLVAVDKGVYVLNNKHRLTQTKIWDVVERLDTGCTAGSGKDSMGVFYDAGLVFETSTAGGTDTRTVHTCTVPIKRSRRSATVMDMQSTLVKQYEDEALRGCCGDGLRVDLAGRSCERRAEYVGEGSCAQAFLHCCQEMRGLKETAKLMPRTGRLFLARSEDDDDMYLSSEDIVSRTQFPESWLWQDLTLPQCPPDSKHCSTTSTEKTSYLKDSATHWQISAISLSETHGMCVAEPLELPVTKSFFIDLRLPHSAKRGEQLEIRTILHNNHMDAMKVRVELLETEHVCSAASKRGSYQTTVELEGMTSRDVSFVVIPMILGTHTIEVKAAVFDAFYGDGIKKELRVVPEGVLTKIQVDKIPLNPSLHGGEQRSEVKFQHLRRQVPNTPASTHIRVQGQELSDIIVNAISGESMGSLFNFPYGNGEENVVNMAMSLIATHYLDRTNQWDKVGVDERAVAVKYIQMGYQKQRSFRKPDGSYGAFLKTPSSTWLTAFVVRVLSMADDIISVDEELVCSALQWLVLNTQQADGSFREYAPVTFVMDSTGKVYGKDSDASLTAFVLIAMQEGRRFCTEHMSSRLVSMGKASRYLHLRILTLKNPYAVTIVSYALADSGKLHKDILFQHDLDDGLVWPVPGGHRYTLEATAYALLALLRMREFDRAGDVVQWLDSQRRKGGGYGSTQSTMMVYQAVAEYRTSMRMLHEVNLEVNIDVSGRSKPIKWTFNKGNAYVSRSDKLQLNQNLTVTAKGSGEGTFSVMTLYYASPTDQDKACSNFRLNLTLEKQAKVSQYGASASYLLKIDIMYMSDNKDASLSVLSIGQLTGFVVDVNDLNRLSSGRERYIQAFEIDNILSQEGSLLIFLDKVSHKRPDTIAFRIHKMADVGLLQPAAVTVYEYYDIENHCVQFYHPEKIGGSLNRLCHNDVCKCAEESCSVQKKEGISSQEREYVACEAGMDYVYKVTVENTNLTTHTDVYYMRVILVVKEGSDVGVMGESRVFVAHPSCRNDLDLNKGLSYLLIGHRKDITRLDGSVQYVLGERTWVEYWPTEEENKEKYGNLQNFAQELSEWGCQY